MKQVTGMYYFELNKGNFFPFWLWFINYNYEWEVLKSVLYALFAATGSILLVHRQLPSFELQFSDVPKQQMKTPAKRRTGEVTANVSTEQTWCTGESSSTGESITSKSAYQIQTFNTTNWYGESAYTGESITINRRIRFQRTTNW